jgi:hypothetical protein
MDRTGAGGSGGPEDHSGREERPWPGLALPWMLVGGVPVYEIPGLKGQNRGLTYLMYDMIGNLVSIYKSVSINYN